MSYCKEKCDPCPHCGAKDCHIVETVPLEDREGYVVKDWKVNMNYCGECGYEYKEAEAIPTGIYSQGDD